MKRRSFLAILASLPAAVAFPATSEATVIAAKRNTFPLLMTYKFEGVERTLPLTTCEISRDVAEFGHDEPEKDLNVFSGRVAIDVDFPVTPEAWSELESMMIDAEERMDISFHMNGGVMSGKFFISCLSSNVTRNAGMSAEVRFSSIGAITTAAALTT